MFYINLFNNFSIISTEFQFISLCWILQARIEEVKLNLNTFLLKIEEPHGNFTFMFLMSNLQVIIL